jgi:ketosteroid isomerase-like protein
MITLILLLSPLFAASPDDLTVKITALDAEVFAAYNNCDLAKFGSFLAEDLEFYHDQGGLSVGRQATVEAVRNNICGKVHRDLIPGTLAAYPLKGYGAVETGTHLFCDPKSTETTGKCGDSSGVGRFTLLWQNKDGAWKITRVISYDHCSRCSTSIPPDFRVAASK